jgi:uncharacterized protein with FMN-binding domain
MKILKFIGIVIVIIIVFFITFAIYMNIGQKEVTAVKINYINLNNVKDGKYIGEFNGYRWSNTVEVTVLDNKITDITFIKGQVFRDKEFEDKLISEVIEKQSIDVDTISGATISSKAILKAIDNAFNE